MHEVCNWNRRANRFGEPPFGYGLCDVNDDFALRHNFILGGREVILRVLYLNCDKSTSIIVLPATKSAPTEQLNLYPTQLNF